MSLYRAFISKQHIRLIRSLSLRGYMHQLKKLSLLLCFMVIGHTLAMIFLEKLSAQDALWLSMTTIATVGYGDLSATTPLGRIASVSLMYLCGIALLSQTAAVYFEMRQARRHKIYQGKWTWKMEDHIVILNAPEHGAERYFITALTQLRSSKIAGSDRPILLVDPALEEISSKLRSLNVANVSEIVTSQAAIRKSNIHAAKTIVILSRDIHDELSDSISYDITARMRLINPKAQIIVEVVEDANRDRLLAAGANHVFRPIRSYPELLIRTILAPGAEKVIEDLFDAHGEECVRYECEVTGQWGKLICQSVMNNLGTPLAYVNLQGQVISNAAPTDEVQARAFIVLVRDGLVFDQEKFVHIMEQAQV